jgi:hypothetical protein
LAVSVGGRAVDIRKLPAAVLCGTYQDGLIHAFERMIVRRATGEYSHIHHVERFISTYERRREELVREKRYHDAAYAEGYQNGLVYLINSPRDRVWLPLYFVYGSKKELRTLAAFKREARDAESLHKGAFAQAEKLANRWSPTIVPHHRPEL